ncbi:MAG TPA: hypothetical protein VIF62_33290 [Labilithrix sp.]|jgi:hypothetical protein
MTKAIAAVIVALVVIAVAWGARVFEGHRALADANAALVRGDLVEAVLAAREAAEARCPSCGSPDAAYAKLVSIADDAERRGDDATAFSAWRAVRAAALATSRDDERTRADAELARLGHRMDITATVAGARPTPAAAEDRLRSALAASDVPRTTTYVVLAAGAAIFLWGAFRFALARAARRADAAVAAAGVALACAGLLLF